jgi:hypothetical protein
VTRDNALIVTHRQVFKRTREWFASEPIRRRERL